MAADGCWDEPSREQPPAEARGPIKVPLPYHQDRGCIRFLEGCPANHAALLPDRPAHPLKRGAPGGGTFSTPMASRQVRAHIGLRASPYRNRNFVTSFLDPLIAFV